MSQVQITGDSFSIGGGRSQPLGSLMQVEVGPADVMARSAVIFITCCLCPIAAVVAGRQVLGESRWFVTAALGAMPFVGIIISVLWRRPWGVIGEFPTRYRTLYRTRDRAEADAMAERLRGALRR